ncbi:hypothetical protein CYQ69_11280 [Enterococcus faecium]|nr:hypothetical protein CYQ69_11280 [Enterococcus faecium]
MFKQLRTIILYAQVTQNKILLINNKVISPLFFRLRQELCVNGKAHSVDQVKTLILMYHVFL